MNINHEPGAAARRALHALAGEHVAYEAMAAYADGTSSAEERADVENHIAMCAACADELADLMAFREEPAPVGAQVEQAMDAPAPRRTPSWWWLAAAAAVIGLAILLASWPRPRPKTELEQPVVKQTPPPAPPQERAPAPAPQPEADVARFSPALEPVVAALRNGTLPAAAMLAQLRPAAGQHRSGDIIATEDVSLLAPVGVVVDEVRPRFGWTAKQGAWIVEVFDAAFTRVAMSDALTTGSWMPEQPLPRGSIYHWQLTRAGEERLVVPAPPDPPARFRIISGDAAAEIARAAPLDRALLYAREGMINEAAAAFERLADDHPGVPLYAELERAARRLR